MRISGNIVDVVARDIYPGTVFFGETVTAVEPGGGPYDTYLVPGYIDAHIHIESTMLMPAAFSWCVAPHGTAAVVADPHEIANVCGMDGIALMKKGVCRHLLCRPVLRSRLAVRNVGCHPRPG
jgi:adenine deaminase